MNVTSTDGSVEPKQLWRRVNTGLLLFTCNSSHFHGMLSMLTRQANFFLLSLCRSCSNTARAQDNENDIIRADVGKAWTQTATYRQAVTINTITCANFPLISAVPRWFTTSRPLLLIGMILLWHWLMDQINCVHPMHYAHEYPRLKDQ